MVITLEKCIMNVQLQIIRVYINYNILSQKGSLSIINKN